MGYTHYWSQTANIAPADWIEFAEGAERLVALVEARGVPLNDWSGEGEDGGRPTVNGREVSFNGTGDDSHESFRILRRMEDDADWFCKTNRKPYDVAVAAVLIYLDSIEPDAFATRSDGQLPNYRDALDLARQAWPSKANMLDFPRSLRDKARYADYVDSSDRYMVIRSHGGDTLIEDIKAGTTRRLPADMQGAGYDAWCRNVPDSMRRYGSFKGDYEACETKRLKAVWKLAEPFPVPTIVYDPLIHGLIDPETTCA